MNLPIELFFRRIKLSRTFTKFKVSMVNKMMSHGFLNFFFNPIPDTV